MYGMEVQSWPLAVQRVVTVLEALQHPHRPVMLDDAVRTAQQAADAAFVKKKTGFTIGGVAPLAHAVRPVADVTQVPHNA